MRYLRLLAVQLRTSVVTSMEYRLDFLIEGGMSVFWMAWNLIPLLILFAARDTVAGWGFEESLLVIGWFTILRALVEGAINPSLVDIVERIRTGAFDYILLKPVDAQFLVSTFRFRPWKIVDFVGGVGLLVYACIASGARPGFLEIAAAGALVIAAAGVLYSAWILIISACFWVVRLDNLAYLFTSVFDAGRWPVQVFRGAWRVIFTLVIPLALMTTYPAMALLGTLELRTALYAIVGALLFMFVARRIWLFALGHYTSASS